MTFPDLQWIRKELEQIDSKMTSAENDFASLIVKTHPSNRKTALNLLHYLVLRCLDIRDLQDHLHAAGLSSLASSESHIRGQLQSILGHLGVSVGAQQPLFDYKASKESTRQKVSTLFGQRDNEQIPFIMVTLDTCYADDYAGIKNLVQSGMNIARINCAHDDESTWFRMIQHIRRATKVTGMPCKIYMDLAGPKIRTTFKGKDKLKVAEGHQILLTDDENLKKDGKNVVGCTVPAIAQQLRIGDTVLFDDGLIEARVEKNDGHFATLQIMRISSKKPYIKKEKGINFPDTLLIVPALTEYDKHCLPFILKYADIVGYSFVRSTQDIMELRSAISTIDTTKNISLVLKIETPEAVKNLPSLLFCGLQEENVGVMIARGDLAVEIGFERMSEIQEEILWICEAAHIPVIWATQVLENLNKSGIATRSEITDAAHAASADCVMINKGQYIIRVIETLKDVLTRSGGHHAKKRYIFRTLGIASRFIAS